ncbi:DUF2358 domain-containing protein [Synechocystis sp. PCC 7339]|uniref:DUF2358 domain-containing protein n=1 Tax=unclassified Synechocystis TaxID=2640012 RepID=UPI001BAF195C|nr:MULTISPECIES: DUF2358 domain-containing protein [unclassified Synechocystis]QUS62019.1 DUF2358 domain-containing protein [Synechocystis sp. PCC 7338]UAJ74218.1 DUF2358 domain-containing protein [Synechocystis sp. PCC 7339]
MLPPTMERPKMTSEDSILTILQRDYANFPWQQTLSIYDADVYFQDPLTRFRGLARYEKMIQFLARWFQAINLQLHDIAQVDQEIITRWTLSWTTPLPWKPRIAISGRSELTLNKAGLIISHIDYWDCSPWDVVKQHFQ